MTQEFGVGSKIWRQIIDTCKEYPINKLIVYGSRARGTHKQGSDVDIAIDAPKLDSK